MAEKERGDLVLKPNEFAFLANQTNGQVSVVTGPYKHSLSDTDKLVVFDPKTKTFINTTADTAVQQFVTAPQGWYVIQKNPGKEGKPPKLGNLSTLTEDQLEVGRKVNIPGPVSFPLWPGQMVKVVKGHQLRTNQYLLVEVYDAEAAKQNWEKTVMTPQVPSPEEESKKAEGEQKKEAGKESEKEKLINENKKSVPPMTIGQLFIIKGTEVSFYIPPTGVKVVPDKNGEFVRDAVTLERLEYCILLDENGNKSYVKGPDVVFPKPTEQFVEDGGQRKFKAIELNEISGIYVKVIAAYEEGGHKYNVGDELFITGKDQMIYFPRPEHAIIKYGEQIKHYAVAVPAGEGRYVLNRISGVINLIKGPSMLLPDPKTDVIVRRVLDPKIVSLMYPGNQQALVYNQLLQEMARKKGKGEDFLTEREVKRGPDESLKFAAQTLVADDFNRGTSFTPPRTVTLDTKFDGAVSMSVWTGYAILLVRKTGERRVVVGPASVLLEYNEQAEAMELSTGTPKSADNKMQTVYLRVLNNRVSDFISVETKDFVQVQIRLSFRVNFEGDSKKWFDVENYVQFLADHTRSMIRNAVKQIGIEDFYANSIAIIRDTILGKAGEGGKRPGRVFAENDMRIYDVEVLDVRIADPEIANLLEEAQHSAVSQAIEIAQEKRRLDVTKTTEEISQQIAAARATTSEKNLELQVQETKKRLELNLAQITSSLEVEKQKQSVEAARQETLNKVSQAELARAKAGEDQRLAIAKEQLDLTIKQLESEVKAVVDKATAVKPDLIAALQAFGDKGMLEKMTQAMAPLAIIKSTGVYDVLAALLKGTPLAKVLEDMVRAKAQETKA